MMIRQVCLLLVSFLLLTVGSAPAQEEETLPGTESLTWQGDISAQMVAGIDRALLGIIEEAARQRENYWQRDFSSRDAYEASVQSNRERFRKILGVVDTRSPVKLEIFSANMDGFIVAETSEYRILQVRWPTIRGIWAEGLLLDPKSAVRAKIVALPDADHTPEQLSGLAPGIEPASQFARVLAENGFLVLVPALVDRGYKYSGNPNFGNPNFESPRMTNMPHREWLYRMSYQMGRHLIGYEIQKVLAAVDWFESQGDKTSIGVAGYGEGGLLALYSAAVDTRIDACLVSGYFQPRERVWEEPIYRNIWSLLREFGDAEIAGLVMPRSLIIENSEMPRVEGSPPAITGLRNVASPGRIKTPPVLEVEREVERAYLIWLQFPAPVRGSLELIPRESRLPEGSFGSIESLQAFLEPLTPAKTASLQFTSQLPGDQRKDFDPSKRQEIMVRQIESDVQYLLNASQLSRDHFFLDRMPTSSAEEFARNAIEYRNYFWKEVIGKVTEPYLDPSPRTRKVYDAPGWTGYEVVLDVWPDVFAWGVLLIPRDIKPGEKRPVVVAQHGLEGLPRDVIETEGDVSRVYKAYAAQLADRGFIVFAPHNPNRGGDKFRKLQLMANPVKLSLFSFITGQHQQLLDWLKTLPYVDDKRIGLYGLSYGGKTAMRVPALLEDYALSICSADFNEWIRKNVAVDGTQKSSYMFTGEYEMYEFDLGQTFNYAEMAYLIFPRPFMVERGHRDGVGLDEWVAYEYAKVRRLYNELGRGSYTEIEFFKGGHVIHGEGTFRFLHRFLEWPERSDSD